MSKRPFPGGYDPQESTRGKPILSGPEPVKAPGIPGSLGFPAGAIFTPEVIKTLDQVITFAIQRAFDNYSIYTQVKPFKNFEIVPVPMLAGVVTALDVDHRYTNARAIFIVNPSGADALWINKTASVAALNGIPLAANFGSYMAATDEYVPYFAFCVGANTAIAVWYF